MEDRRTDILEAACTVIARSGIHDLRVEDVAQEAGVSRALVYYYFPTRAELLSRTFAHANARSTDHTMQELGAETNSLERIENILVLELSDAPEVRRNWIIWNEVSANAVFDPELLDSVEKWSADWVRMIADLVRAGQAEGSIAGDVDPVEAGEHLTGVLDGLGSKWMLGIMPQKRAIDLVLTAVRRELGKG